MFATAKRRTRLADQLFDRNGVVRRPSYAGLPREFLSLFLASAASPDPAALPRGDGHTVLVIPAFLTHDILTRPMRRFLSACGYRAEGWGLGLDWGPTDRIMRQLRAKLDALYVASGAPVSVIGVSLGGVLARDLAYDRADRIRDVATLASPYHLPTATTIELLYRGLLLFHSEELDLSRLSEPLPVSSTAIYTRDDGIVAWQSCFSTEANCLVAEVDGPHMSIGQNPAALRLLATRLAAMPASATRPSR